MRTILIQRHSNGLNSDLTTWKGIHHKPVKKTATERRCGIDIEEVIDILQGGMNIEEAINILQGIKDGTVCLMKDMPKRGEIAIDMAINALSKQRIGKWVPSDSQCGIRCSACGVPVDDFCHSIDYIDLDYEPNFCPNCGLPMKGINNADTKI